MTSLLLHPHEGHAHQLRAAYEVLFGGEALDAFEFWQFTRPDDEIRIDLLAYGLGDAAARVIALVTNGLSDWSSARCELVQYVPKVRGADLHRLHALAYGAAAEGRQLDYACTVSLPAPAGSAWPHAVLLPPPVAMHAEVPILPGEAVKLLWHVPLAESEFVYQREHGLPALVEAMGAAQAPWVFDEATRPVLL